MRYYASVSGFLRHFDGIESLGQRTDLVDLDQDRVGDALFDSFLQDRRIRDEQVVADQLDLLAQTVSQLLPAVPVTLAQTMETIGYFSIHSAYMSIISSVVLLP